MTSLEQATGATPRERVVRAVMAFAMLGLAPAIVVIPTYRAGERIHDAWPALERALRAMDDGFARSVRCDPDGGATQRLSWDAYQDLRGGLTEAAREVGKPAEGVRDQWPGEMLAGLVPGASGIVEIKAAESALFRDYSWLNGIPLCVIGRNPTPARLAEAQAWTDRILAEARTQFAARASDLAAARISFEAKRPLLAALAWALGIIEVVGWTLVLVMRRADAAGAERGASVRGAGRAVTVEHAAGATRLERAARVVAALAMLGLGPALVVFPTHLAADRIRAAWPELDSALKSMLEVLERGVDCAPDAPGTERAFEVQLSYVTDRLVSARWELDKAAQAASEGSLGRALILSGRGPRAAAGLREALNAAGALEGDLSRLRGLQVCGGDAFPWPNRLVEEQARTDGILGEVRMLFAWRASDLASARASFEAGRPLLTPLAWLLGVIEVVGWGLALVLLPGDIRTLRARRAARAGRSEPP